MILSSAFQMKVTLRQTHSNPIERCRNFRDDNVHTLYLLGRSKHSKIPSNESPMPIHDDEETVLVDDDDPNDLSKFPSLKRFLEASVDENIKAFEAMQSKKSKRIEDFDIIDNHDSEGKPTKPVNAAFNGMTVEQIRAKLGRGPAADDDEEEDEDEMETPSFSTKTRKDLDPELEKLIFNRLLPTTPPPSTPTATNSKHAKASSIVVKHSIQPMQQQQQQNQQQARQPQQPTINPARQAKKDRKIMLQERQDELLANVEEDDEELKKIRKQKIRMDRLVPVSFKNPIPSPKPPTSFDEIEKTILESKLFVPFSFTELPLFQERHTLYDSEYKKSLEQILLNLGTFQIQSPTKIQAAAIPVMSEGNSMILHAQTGSGKTIAYLLPLVKLVNPALPKVTF